MKIKYGTVHKNIDITKIVYKKCLKDKIIYIPKNDNKRAHIFSDPIKGSLKYIFIDDKKYDSNTEIYININNGKIYTKNIPAIIIKKFNKSSEIEEKLKKIHSKLKIKYGSFDNEYPEQIMVAKYIKGHEKILEIGSNIGRNTLVIAHILNNNNNFNFVSLECDKNIAEQLLENKKLNNSIFHIENKALSKKKLIQKGWDTIQSDILLDGFKNVEIITFDEIKKKYKIEFDTLILDCEGAFYYILQDMPEILININLIIMENDYNNILHKNYIDTILKKNKFNVVYTKKGGWGPCKDFFYEVWKKF